MVTTFFPDISQFSVDSLLSEAYPPKHGCPLPSTWWVVRLQASTLLAEEGWLLGQHHLFIMTRSLPWPNKLLTFIKTCPSSGSLTSLGAAYGPISLFDPFTSIIAPWILLFLSSRKSRVSILGYRTFRAYDISLRVGVFSPAMGMLLTLRQLGCFSIYSARCLVPHILRYDENHTVEIFSRDSSGNFPAYFPLLYKLLKESKCPTFWIFNSQEPVRGALSHIFVSNLQPTYLFLGPFLPWPHNLHPILLISSTRVSNG